MFKNRPNGKNMIHGHNELDIKTYYGTNEIYPQV